MKLPSLQYKDYIWPHNPTTYSVQFVKDLAEHKYVNVSGAEIEDFGIGARIFSGSGAFFGLTAYSQFSILAKTFYEKGPGKLIHPVWMPTMAIFSKLSVKEEPLPYYVEYDFEFIESRDIDVIKELIQHKTNNNNNNNTNNQQSSGKSVTHTVKQGETLSYIGQLYGVPWRQIATDNTKLIKDPNSLQIGWKLVINNPKKIPSKNSTPSQSSGKRTIYRLGFPLTVDDKPNFLNR